VQRRNAFFNFAPSRGAQPGAKYRSPGLISSKRQKRVASMIRKRRGGRSESAGGFLGDVVAALRDQGYSAAEARSMAKRAKGNDFDSRFRDALRRNPLAKKKRKTRKRRQPAALARYWKRMRAKKTKRRAAPKKRKNSRRRPAAKRRRTTRGSRRNLRLNMSLSPKQKRTLARFLRSATGKRVTVK
jgi:hypothetical protein